MEIEDKLLIKEIQKQNRRVFESLFHDHYPGLTRFAEGFVFDRDVSEDIVQSLFIYLWEHAENLNISSSIKSYLYFSIKNRCLNHLRGLKIQDQHHILYMEATLNEEGLAGEDSDITRQIASCLEKLPPKMAEIFKLKYLEEHTVKEIATQLEVSENTVKTQLLRAKEKLRMLLLKSTRLKFFL